MTPAAPTASPSATAIVTGANAGLGRETARALLARGWHVVLACRDLGRGAEAVAAIGGGEVVGLELASLDDVRAFPGRLEARDRPPLRALVANAGVQATDDGRRTRDGFELTFGVNHLAHFLLVELLRPRLVAPARIVMVSSGTHFGTLRQSAGYRPDWRHPDDLARPAAAPRSGAAGRTAYATSKLAAIHHVHELARRLPAGITANAFDPGLMPGTGLARDFPAPVRAVWDRLLPRLVPRLPFASTPQASGEALAALAADPAWDGVSGAYVDRGQVIRSSPASYDAAREAELWTRSEVLTGLSAPDAAAPAAASSDAVRAA